MTNWNDLPIQSIPIDLLVYPCHDINPDHIHAAPDIALSTGPIHVQALIDGHYYIHDGRHRTIRATLNGHTHINARIHR